MKYSDLASIGIASGAYLEASRAHSGVNQLSRDISNLKKDVDSRKEEQEFQKWAEELIYQFDKTVTNVSNSPQDPVHDYIDIATFLLLIENPRYWIALKKEVGKACIDHPCHDTQNLERRFGYDDLPGPWENNWQLFDKFMPPE